MKKPSLQQYFIDSQKKGILDHVVRATDNGENVLFYIRPQNANGETLDFSVKGNELTQLRISPEDDLRKYITGYINGMSLQQLQAAAKALGI